MVTAGFLCIELSPDLCHETSDGQEVRPEDRERFNRAAEKADLINGEFFRSLLDKYDN